MSNHFELSRIANELWEVTNIMEKRFVDNVDIRPPGFDRLKELVLQLHTVLAHADPPAKPESHVPASSFVQIAYLMEDGPWKLGAKTYPNPKKDPTSVDSAIEDARAQVRHASESMDPKDPQRATAVIYHVTELARVELRPGWEMVTRNRIGFQDEVEHIK